LPSGLMPSGQRLPGRSPVIGKSGPQITNMFYPN
jgi:hypothetical protein